jgi:subtilisin family serine protease
MKMKTKIFAVLFTIAFLTTLTYTIKPARSSQEIRMGTFGGGCFVDPVRVEALDMNTVTSSPGMVPFNVDMHDAEKAPATGDGVYVAVLDTGLLSNYLDFFPEGMVDIKEEWGIGFTHDVYYDPAGAGDWSIEYVDGVEYRFSYGPLRNDRGFITHDDGAPEWVYYPPDDAYYPFGYGSGHGTHVTSIVTGYHLFRGTVDTWVAGIAPKVTIIPVLVLDDWVAYADDGNGWLWTGGTWEMVAAGIRYIGDLAKKHNVKIIINMSLGGSAPGELEEAAIDYAIKQGVIVVASAGNEGTAGMGWPGAFPQVISVAAAGWTQEYLRYYTGAADPWYWWTDDVPENLWTTDPLGNKFQVYLTEFSSRPNPELGQHIWDLDVAACGAGVKGPYKGYGPGQWGWYSVWGTSQAAPHVAGIAALVAQKFPKVNQGAMEICLEMAALGNRLTKGFETSRSADVYDIFSLEVVTYSWTWKDYGTGLLQADDALCVATWMFGWKYRCPGGTR